MIFSHVFVLIEKHRYMIKIFRGGRDGDTFKTPFPLRIAFALPTPCFKTFLERSLNDLHPPPPHFKHPSLLPPSPSTTPPPLKILIVHLPDLTELYGRKASWDLQSSRVPPVVRGICLEYQQFSRALPVVQSTYGCREYL